jgi:hypothetical protein
MANQGSIAAFSSNYSKGGVIKDASHKTTASHGAA